MKKRITLFIILCLALIGQAQVTKTVNITRVGTLLSSVTKFTTTNSARKSKSSNLMIDTLGIAPSVTTINISNITATTAISGGNLTDTGSDTIFARGVCWSTTANPTIVDSQTEDGYGTGVFSSSITGLTAEVTYHVRAYAINSVGTSYGSDLTFTTLGTAPTVTTTTASSITNATVKTGGNVTLAGTSSVTARGVCWGTMVNPTIADSKTIDGSGTGVFTSSITGLSSAQTYHIRAYATNSVSIGYGSDLKFTTLGTAPTITTTIASNITTTTATTGGNITDTGTSTITARGVCWSSTINPTIANSKTTDGTSIGAFTSSISGLTPNTTYHIRAYATNSVGTSYGSDLTLTTICLVPASFSLSSPSNGVWNNTTPLFQWAASAGATIYSLYIDGALKKDNITTNSYQILSSEPINSGMHTWYVEASNGCITQSNETWSFRVDATQPTAYNLVSPADNSWTANTQPTLTWGASTDVNSGLAKYQIWIDGVLNRDNISNTTTSATPSNILSNGSHTWEIRAVDNVGNIRNSTQTWKIKVDNVPPGLVDNCAFFDGIDDYAVTTTQVNTGNILTMEAWIKPFYGKNDRRGIIRLWGNYLTLEQGNKIALNYYVGSSNWNTRSSNTILNNNLWYYVAVTHDNNVGTIKIYINGVLDASYTNCYDEQIQNDVAYIGKGNINRGQNYFYGNIDEVKLWNYERTQTEIQNSMNKAVDAPCINSPLGYWRFNDPIGSTTYKDETNNSYNLSSLNGTSLLTSDKPGEIFGGLCNLIKPNCSQYLSTTTPTFSWEDTPDLGIGFQKFQLWIDDALNLDNLSGLSCTLTTPLSYGQHKWFVKGFDLLGNNQSSYSRTFYIDNVKPNAFNLNSPTNNQIVNLPTPNFTWQATFDSIGGSGMRKYQLLINGVINRDSIPITQTTVAPKNALAQGKYTWSINAYDNLGNVRQSTQTNTFYVDWEDPSAFNLITPLDNSTLIVTRPLFTWHSSNDIGSGINKYELCISGQTPITILPTDTTKLISFDLPNGNYTWFVKAFDGAGAFTSSNTQTFTINVNVTGVEQTELNNSIKVYPNPTTESFHISGLTGIASLKLIDINGKIILIKQVANNESVLVNNLIKGVYIIKIITDEGTVERKLVKK